MLPDSLLLTKLTPPPWRPGLVPRLLLLERLEALLAPGARLGLVCAAAGYGKTTLVGEWLAAHPELQPAWLSLDESDCVPARFWSYLVAALQRVLPGLGSAAQHLLASPGTPVQSALVSLLNELSGIPGRIVLVLDDYHLVENQPAPAASPALNEDLSFFVEHLPQSALVVLTSRQDPPLPLARWRGRGQLVELRTADLRFSHDEAARFLTESAGVTLSQGQVAAVEAQAEGWPAGLVLLAAALRQSSDVDGFLRNFSTSDRYILEYLFAEVFNQQPAQVQAFLLRSSILERMCPALCAAVLLEPEAASRQTLERLDRANLFILPLDSPPAWYRYHHLFSVLLRQRLGLADEESVNELHARAAAWQETHGYLDEALAHWLSAGEVSQAARLVQENALACLDRGELLRLAGWMDQLPPGEIERNPWLSIFQAWMLLLTGQLPRVAPRLLAAERLGALPGNAAGHIAAIRAYLGALMGDLPTLHAQAELALELLDEQSLGTRAVVWYVLGGAALLGGDFPAASQAFQKAGEQGLAGGNRHVAIPALNSWVGQLIWQGQLIQAEREAQRVLRLASTPDGRPLPYASGVLASLARIAYEWNELEAALSYARQAVAQGDLWGQAEGLVYARLVLAQVLAARGEWDAAALVVDETVAMQPSYAHFPFLVGQVGAAKAILDSQGGRQVEARRWAELLDPTGHSLIRNAEWLAQARVLLAADLLTGALAVLEALPNQAGQAGLDGIAIQALALKACALQQSGDAAAALAALGTALGLAEADGFLRSFLDSGPAMAALLRKARHAGIAPAYCTRLLAAFPSEPASASTPTVGCSSRSASAS